MARLRTFGNATISFATKKPTLTFGFGMCALSLTTYATQRHHSEQLSNIYKKTEEIVKTIRSTETPTYPTLELGEISSTGSKDLLFVPGSISDANYTGYQFSKEFEKKFGIEPSYVNSQMDFLEYPGQLLETDSAQKRNNMVVTSIKNFIKNSPTDDVTIFAHSAGSKSALIATKKYLEENPDSTKKIKINLLGAGSPEGGMDQDIKSLSHYPQISIEELRTKFDLVPSAASASTQHKITPLTSERSELIMEGMSTHLAETDDPFSDPHSGTKRTAESIEILKNIAQEHFIESYIEAMSTRHINKAKESTSQISYSAKTVKTMLAEHSTSETNYPTTTPTAGSVSKPKQKLK